MCQSNQKCSVEHQIWTGVDNFSVQKENLKLTGDSGFLRKNNLRKLNKILKANIDDEDEVNFKDLINESIKSGNEANLIPLDFTQNE